MVTKSNGLTESEVETVLPNENGVEIVTLADFESRADTRGTRLTLVVLPSSTK